MEIRQCFDFKFVVGMGLFKIKGKETNPISETYDKS